MSKFVRSDNIKEAEQTLKIHSISNVCNKVKRHKTSGGFYWRFESDGFNFKLEPPKANSKPKPVLQISLEGEIIKKWNSINEAEKTLKINNIGKVCRNEVKTSGGFKWKFAEQDQDQNSEQK